MVKKIIFLATVFGLAAACTEIAPDINPGGSTGNNVPGNVQNQERQVLLEEFTGVRCINCPAASEKIEQFKKSYGSRFIAYSIHAGPFAKPYANENKLDFRTADGDNLLAFHTEPIGYPSGVINRKKFAGETGFQLNQNQWAGYIDAELKIAPEAKMEIKPAFNETSRLLTFDVDVYPQASISNAEVRLTALLVEDGMIDVQLTPQGKNAGYIHKRVLRKVITAYDGNPIQQSWNVGTRITIGLAVNLSPDWVAENCRVIAFVSTAGEERRVLQAYEVEVK